MSISNKIMPEIKTNENWIEVSYGDRCIRIAPKHKIYLNDIICDFDSYFNAVEYQEKDGTKFIDFSSSKSHKVNGYEEHLIMFSSFPEPISTAFEYADFAQLNENSVMLDLGAYSGLTSIFFDKQIAKDNKNAKGKVIAVDPDIFNKPCIEYNFKEYQKVSGRKIDYLFGAAWGEDCELEFSNEANMGASATCIVGNERDAVVQTIPAYSLSTIAQKFNLEKIDFIKCDIEGGEISLFKDKNFFKKYNPKIILECHFLENRTKTTTPIVIQQLKKYGYICKAITQIDLYAPILECYPATTKGEKFARILPYYLKIALESIFSLKNTDHHKVLKVLGLKVKFKRKKK